MSELRIGSLVILLAMLGGWATGDTIDPDELTLEALFRVKPFQARAARELAFSEDERFLAYLWSPLGEAGPDLYLHDTRTGETRRVTSLEGMRRFDPPAVTQRFLDKQAQKERDDDRLQRMYEAQRAFLRGEAVDLGVFEREAIEALKREAEEKRQEAERRKQEEAGKEDSREGKDGRSDAKGKDKDNGNTDSDKKGRQEQDREKEDWEWRDELIKKTEKERVKPEDLYPGVRRFVWSRTASELIFEYRGDLFRHHAETDATDRLTMTDDPESIVAYTPDGQGYFYRTQTRVYRARFDSSLLLQVNPAQAPTPDEEAERFQIQSTTLSPDGAWMVIVSSKAPERAAPKEVQIMNYKGRWAEPIKVRRETPDDKRRQPEYRFTVRDVRIDNYGPEPDPVHTIPGGDVWHQTSGVKWSEDSSRYLFTTWEREKDNGRLRIWMGRAEVGARPEIVYENPVPLGHETFPLVDAQFSPDGQRIVAILDEHEFRQPYLIDPATRTATRLLSGAFEAHPVIGFTPDSQGLYTLSNQQHPAMNGIYRLALNDPAAGLAPVGLPDGMHRATAMSRSGRLFASVYGNWAQRPELRLLEAGEVRHTLTDSLDPDWARFDLIRPELFQFPNRHGDTLHGMVFKPAGWQPEDRRPAVVYVYGGPLGRGRTVESDTFNSRGYLFQMYLAARHGYVTVCVDPRGQSSYGRRFSGANFGQPGHPQTEDLEDLARHMGEGFGVDVARIGLDGWSFGGFQTQMTLFTSPDTFACGIAGAGPTEWENYNAWYSGATIDRSVRGRPTLRRHSLIPLAHNLKKPLLLVHGMMDDNVLYQDTVNVYRALLQAGKERLVELFLDPDGKHGMSGVVFNKARFSKYEEFYLRHLGLP